MIYMCWYDEKADHFILHSFDAGVSSFTLTLTSEQIVKLAKEIEIARAKQCKLIDAGYAEVGQ